MYFKRKTLLYIYRITDVFQKRSIAKEREREGEFYIIREIFYFKV